MLRKVNSSVYDHSYFKGRYGDFDIAKIKSTNEFDYIYQKSGSMIKLSEGDKAVDLGCGTGQLAFYLVKKYDCEVTGVDYSQDAIEICQNNLEKIKNDVKSKINFILSSNENLPDFKEIKAVFMVDVIEHLYDEEIDFVLKKIKQWSGQKGIYLIVHTDNNNYLKFIRPITDFFSVILRKTNYKRIREEKKYVLGGHVNLTTMRRLKNKLRLKGFQIIKAEYPPMDFEITKNHLGPIGKNPFIFYPIYFLGKLLFFLRPTIYLLAKYKPTK